jgi:hypothetical protein
MDLLLATWDSMEELSTFGESEEIVAPLDVITPKSTNSLFISRENHSMGST